MPAYFFDTSALLKRWLDEPGADRVRTLTGMGTGHRLYAARGGAGHGSMAGFGRLRTRPSASPLLCVSLR